MTIISDWTWKTPDVWYRNLNAMFGNVKESTCGYFNANVLAIPPIVYLDPPDSIRGECFIFEEITSEGVNEPQATIMLLEHIEDYIHNAMTEPRDTSKAAIVWRIPPEVKYYPIASPDMEKWQGYARLKVLDSHSEYQSYR